ncbi:LamG domain-containing protein [Ferruginibacter sp. SUN106]|uniref:LamG domain-containing protein n=1 Tax=Ferruginibacter sp. SUN106 TaxID=2978348 RepID=UPI003D36AD1A
MKKYFLLIILFYVNQILAQNNNAAFTKTQNGLLNGASIFTVEFWVKTSNTKSNDTYWQRPYLFGNETNGNNSGDLGITINNGYIGMYQGISNLNTDQQFLSTSIRVNDNFWHHIAAVNNGQTLNLYVDGNIVGSLVSGRQLITNSAPLTFGGASLDHNFSGNFNNTNFFSQSAFGDARISNVARYTANFQPPGAYTSDGNTVSLYHLSNQTNIGNNNTANVAINIDPNRPVTIEPGQAISKDYAQQATLFINDSIVLYGKLLLGKKDWSLNNEIGIHFFENGSKKAKFYKAGEIKGFQMGDSYYEPKFLGAGGAINTPLKKTIVKRLTPADSKMAMYEYLNHTSTKNGQNYIEYKDVLVYFVQLPNTTNDKIYQFSDNKFVPDFEKKVSNIVADKPVLAEKIKSKDKDYWYAFVTGQAHQNKVWWNIITEYNKP